MIHKRLLLAVLLLLRGADAQGQSRQAAQTLLESADAVWNLGDAHIIKDGRALTAQGGARLNQSLTGGELLESQVRGGGDQVASLHGGWLSSEGALPAVEGKITPFTVHLRARLETQEAMTLFYWGGGKARVRIYSRMAGTDPTQHGWDTTRQNYLSYAGQGGTAMVLEAEAALYNDKTTGEQLVRVGVPYAMIGTNRWHDITLRFSGATLDLLVDGVLVDVGQPKGNILRGDSFLFGAEPGNSGVGSCFNGSMATAAIWNRSLSDAEVATLAGGTAMVARRDREILGPETTSLQYFTPREHNTWVGDTMCYYHDGRFHLLYFLDRRHKDTRSFAHASSTNLVTWEHHPLAIQREEQYEEFGTGSMLFHDGLYYLFYGMHTDRNMPRDQTMIVEARRTLKETRQTEPVSFFKDGKYPMGSSYATSTDGIHFKKSNEIIHPSQNPTVFTDEKAGEFMMLAGYGEDGLYSSKDFRHWKTAAPLVPYNKVAPMQNTSECQCYFEWNGWHYLIGGRTGFWLARDQHGPYFAINGHSLGSGSPCIPRWDIYDGLWVPMVAPFKDNRRILAGWAMCGKLWGGALVFRELIQEADGTLGMKWPLEMIPESEAPIAIPVKGNVGVQGDVHDLQVSSDTFTYATIEHLPPNVRITMRIEPGPKAEAFGICVGGNGAYESGCELQFLPRKKQAQWGSPRNGSLDYLAPDMAAIVASNQGSRFVGMWDLENSNPHIPFKTGDFAISNVEGLDRAFTLDLIVKRDKAGATLVDACIDNRRTMITWRKRLTGDRLFLFSFNGDVRFRDIIVRPLKEAGNSFSKTPLEP